MRRTILILLAIPLGLVAQIDSVEVDWVQQYGSGLIPSWDVASAMTIDAAGNIYVTGASEYHIGHWEPSYGNFTTIKYNPDGTEAWVAHYDGPANGMDQAAALAVDMVGNVYVTGSSEGDYATIKYSSDGTEVWVARYNGPGHYYGEATALAIGDSGNVYVTGSSNGDYATIKYNPDGTEVWVARYDGPGSGGAGANAVAVDAEDNVYVTGGSDGTSGGYEYATIKYNPDGTEAWVTCYNGSGNSWDEASALALDAMGNVYVTGRSVGSENNDYATIKYNPDGSEAWVSRYNGPGNDSDGAGALAVDAAGNIYVTGYSWSAESSYDYATIKYNPNGSEAWVSRYNGPGNERDNPSALAIDGDGNVYVAGNSEGAAGDDDYATIKYNPDGTEVWVARYNGPGNDRDKATLAVDGEGNVYVTGSSNMDYATIKYSPDGAEAWVSSYDGPAGSCDVVSDMAVDESGNIYVTGSSRSSDSYDGSDYATIKYNPDGTEVWVARYDGTGNDYDGPSALAIGESGNIYVTGFSNQSDNWESADYTTIKYNLDGTEAWVARYDGPGNNRDYTNDLAVDGAGNVYVTGGSEGSENYDYATIKYNPDGTEAWVSRYNGPGNADDGASAIAVDAAGNVYVIGYSEGSESSDYATIKYNPDGTEAWVSRYNGPGNADDEAGALVLDAAGNVYVTGGSEGSESYDYATIKYNPDGTEAWVARYDGPGDGGDGASAIAVDAAGNVYVTGYSEGSESSDYATIKYNPDGTEVWVARYNGPENGKHEANALVLDDAGNVYVTGSRRYSDSYLSYSYATIKYNPDGTEAWAACYTGSGAYYGDPTALAVDAAGNVYVAGASVYQIGTDYFNIQAVRAKYIIIKYIQPGYAVSTKPNMWPSQYRLQQNYPNPFNPTTTIQYSLPEAGAVNLTIFDIQGQEVTTLQEVSKLPGNYEVQWNGLNQSGNPVSTGVYFCRLEAGSYSQTIKMLFLK